MATSDRNRTGVDLPTWLVGRLREDRPRLEHAIHARIRDVAPGANDANAEYEAGQFVAIAEALDCTPDGIERGVNPEQPVPTATLTQPHRAARHDVSLETILRRHHVAQSTLASAIERHIQECSLAGDPRILRSLADLHDLHNLRTAEVAAEYAGEAARLGQSPAERRAHPPRRAMGPARIRRCI
jgi:hypothetical protein